MKKYRLFDHTADIGCEIYGKTRRELFSNASTAVIDLIFESRRNSALASSKTRHKEKTVLIRGHNLEDLLINFLREILYLFNGKSLVTKDCAITELSTRQIVALLEVENYNPQKHFIKTEIKAVTYHDCSIAKTGKEWKAKVIFDV